jgi:hypothetical protein
LNLTMCMPCEINNLVSGLRFAGKHICQKTQKQRRLKGQKYILVSQVGCLSALLLAGVQPNLPITIFRILHMPCLFVCLSWKLKAGDSGQGFRDSGIKMCATACRFLTQNVSL